MTMRDEVTWFLENCQPFRQVYARRNPKTGLWPTIPKRLSDDLIAQGLRGEIDIGFFSEPMVDYFILDVDDHNPLGCWHDGEPSLFLEHKWKLILGDVGVPPGLTVGTPHGVHGYWGFDRKVPTEFLEDEVIGLLSVARAEYRPRPDVPVRLPMLGRRLKPDLTPDRGPLMPPDRVPIESLFGNRLDPAQIRARLRRGGSSCTTSSSSRSPATRRIEQAEETYGEFITGETNEPFRSLMAIYYSSRLSEEEALARVAALVNRSATRGYRGGLLNERERTRRVKGSYAGLESAGMKPELRSADVLDDGWNGFANYIASVGEWSETERPGVERFVRELVAWVQHLDKVYDDPGRRVAWNYLHTNFIANMRDGYYPLPSGLLQRWRHDYREVLNVLVAERVIEESPHHYRAGGYCRHYRVNPYRALRHESAIVMTGALKIERPA